MVKFQTDFRKKLFILFCVSFLWLGAAHAKFAGLPEIHYDGNNGLVSVWQASSSLNGINKIQSATGSSEDSDAWMITDLTDASLFDAALPRLATASSFKANPRAAAVWFATDLITKNAVIQVATLGSKGWSVPKMLSLNDGTERPRDDYKVSISAEGTVIGVTWSANLTTDHSTVVRYAYSSNGGNTWSAPFTLSN